MPTTEGLYSFDFVTPANASPPLILIHGVGGTHLSWPAEIRRLAGRDVYTLDLPGHGRSEGHGLQSISAHVDALADWIDTKKLYRAFIVGHSMGGAIALEMCRQHPQKISGLAVISSGAKFLFPQQLVENAANPATYPAALEELRRQYFSAQTPANLKALAGQRLAEIRSSILYADLLACSNFEITDSLETIGKPALILCGADDQLTPVRLSQFLATKIQNAQLEIIPEAGHMVMIEKPREVAARLENFLNENRWRL